MPGRPGIIGVKYAFSYEQIEMQNNYRGLILHFSATGHMHRPRRGAPKTSRPDRSLLND